MEPEKPANIGSIARTAKNMGISDIRLINPCNYNTNDCYKVAHGAKDTLTEFRHFLSLEEATSDINVLIGTTNRRRGKQWPLLTPKEVSEHTTEASQTSKIGVLFGREAHGLYNEELAICNFHSKIPTVQPHPAINLAQAVMIYAHTFHDASIESTTQYDWNPASKEEEQALYEKIKDTLPVLPLNPKQGIDEFVSLFRRVLGRTLLESRDIRLLHKLFDLIQKK
jgi:TrmH family RNA methyltransferase